MRLKNLTLQGYKSFATKTEFLFSEGITAIIGPNGSGKSNIADAIRWSLGEQSMRSLRGRSSSDMIYAGGRRRSQAGMAEVILNLDNGDGALPIEFSEVTITRRAYRSGDNEYLLNGSRVRLRDIGELLAESGLGQGGYAIIGQGMVDAALSLRPQERRALFEDAAGISLYRARREETLSRLDDTQRNVERVQDISNEIAPRVRRLEQEAERVEEYRRLAAHLKRLQYTWYGYRSGAQQTALRRARERSDMLEARLSEHRLESEAQDREMNLLRERESALRAKLQDWHKQSAQLHARADETRRELAVAEERARLLTARQAELQAELDAAHTQRESQLQRIAQVESQAQELQQRMAERQEHLERVEVEWKSLRQKASEPQQRRAEVEHEIRERRAKLDRLNQALAAAQREVSRLENERAVALERATYLEQRYEETLVSLEPLVQQIETQQQRVDQAREGVQELEAILTSQTTRVANLENQWAVAQKQTPEPDPHMAAVETEIRTNQDQLRVSGKTLESARAELARLIGEHEALTRMNESWAAYAVGVQAVLREDLPGVLGPLASLMDVPVEWELAIQAALGDDLQAVVLESSKLVSRAQEIVAADGGRVTLLAMDSVNSGHRLPSSSLRAADVVTCDAPVRPIVEAILGQVALVADVIELRALLPLLPPGSCCTTSTGIVIRSNGAITVGRTGSGDVLVTERLQRKLPEDIERARAEYARIEAQNQQLQEHKNTLEGRLRALHRRVEADHEAVLRAEQEQLNQANTQVAVARESLRSQQATLRREQTLLNELRQRGRDTHDRALHLKAERDQLIARFASSPGPDAECLSPDGFESSQTTDWGDEETSPELVSAQAACARCERDIQFELQQIAGLERELETVIREATGAMEAATHFERETVSVIRTDVAVATEAFRSQEAQVQRERGLLERHDTQIAARERRLAELGAEQESISIQLDDFNARAMDLEQHLRTLRGHIGPAEDEMVQVTESTSRLEDARRQTQEKIRTAELRYGQAELEVARHQDELDLLARRIEEDLGLVELELVERVTAQTPLPLQPFVSRLPIVEILPDGIEDEIKRLKARMNRLGTVNPNAPEEYAEARDRFEFLNEQMHDLEVASSKLRDAVEELDTLIETAFRETFDAVSTHFSELFATLFKGGSARLELTEPQDLMRSGVEIIARPPGKRAQRLGMLSGGERALTAVALLFALLRVSSTPFCVLDEVDAMLDEANVGRFRLVLEEMAEKTQFIVITHNRGTVESAETIYGVSISTDGVSQVVSLKL